MAVHVAGAHAHLQITTYKHARNIPSYLVTMDRNYNGIQLLETHKNNNAIIKINHVHCIICV